MVVAVLSGLPLGKVKGVGLLYCYDVFNWVKVTAISYFQLFSYRSGLTAVSYFGYGLTE